MQLLPNPATLGPARLWNARKPLAATRKSTAATPGRIESRVFVTFHEPTKLQHSQTACGDEERMARPVSTSTGLQMTTGRAVPCRNRCSNDGIAVNERT